MPHLGDKKAPHSQARAKSGPRQSQDSTDTDPSKSMAEVGQTRTDTVAKVEANSKVNTKLSKK